MITIHEYETPSEKCWHMVVRGVRNSWESHEKGDSEYKDVDYHDCRFFLGAADKALAIRLIRAGADHGKFMRQLPVVLDITAPAYFWREFDTYGFTTSNSTSQMHVLGRREFSADMFSWEDMDMDVRRDLLGSLNYLRDEWINSGKRKGPDATEWRAMVQAIPDSWLYRRCVSLNYQVLRSMYHARRNHRLSEWRAFCAWIETLPYSELITVV